MRATLSITVMAAILASLLAACSEGVTPACTSDAGCGNKPAADAATTASP
jgi:hypothetical protein